MPSYHSLPDHAPYSAFPLFRATQSYSRPNCRLLSPTSLANNNKNTRSTKAWHPNPPESTTPHTHRTRLSKPDKLTKARLTRMTIDLMYEMFPAQMHLGIQVGSP